MVKWLQCTALHHNLFRNHTCLPLSKKLLASFQQIGRGNNQWQSSSFKQICDLKSLSYPLLKQQAGLKLEWVLSQEVSRQALRKDTWRKILKSNKLLKWPLRDLIQSSNQGDTNSELVNKVVSLKIGRIRCITRSQYQVLRWWAQYYQAMWLWMHLVAIIRKKKMQLLWRLYLTLAQART